MGKRTESIKTTISFEPRVYHILHEVAHRTKKTKRDIIGELILREYEDEYGGFLDKEFAHTASSSETHKHKPLSDDELHNQAYELRGLADELREGTKLLEEKAAEHEKKREQYFKYYNSKNLTVDEEIAAYELRIEANAELEELHALRHELLSKRERMEELSQSLVDAGFWR